MRAMISFRKYTTRQNGFTLIELLVVIAIIAILAAILFPVFAMARDKARQTVCLSNMKQIGTAARLYMNDYDGLGPYPGSKSTGEVGCLGASNYRSADDPHSLPQLFQPYLKNLDVWVCPNAPEWEQRTQTYTIAGKTYTLLPNSYVYNLAGGLYLGTGAQSDQGGDLTTSRIFIENIQYAYYTGRTELGTPSAILAASKYYYPHMGGKGYNTVYLDGHTKIFIRN